MMYHQQVGERLMLEERWDRFGDHQLALQPLDDFICTRAGPNELTFTALTSVEVTSDR